MSNAYLTTDVRDSLPGSSRLLPLIKSLNEMNSSYEALHKLVVRMHKQLEQNENDTLSQRSRIEEIDRILQPLR